MVNVVTIAAALLWLALPSCQKDPSKRNDSNATGDSSRREEPSQQKAYRYGWHPAGTVWEADGGILSSQGPEGWGYIGYSANGRVLHVAASAKKSISCSCNTSGTCKPFHATGPAGSTDGCTGTCSNCTMQQSLRLSGQEHLLRQGGYYNVAAAVRVLKPGEAAPAVFDALLLELPAFREQLLRFVALAYYGHPMALPVKNRDGSLTAPEGYGLLALSVMGRALVTVVPESFTRSRPGTVLMKKASCDCSKGSCALKDRTILGTGAIWCDGDCSGTCTLTLDSGQSGIAPVRIFSYAF